MSNFKGFSTRAVGIFSFLASTSLVFANPAQAVSIDLGSWTRVGDVDATGNQANISTASFTAQDDFPQGAGAFNYSGNNPVAAGGAIETAVGLNPGGLDNPAAPFFGAAFEGSAITTNLNVRQGDRLSFDWNFLTNDTLDDYAFFVANGVITTLANVSDASNSSSTNFNSETGARTFNYTFANAGNYQVGIGIVDIGDFSSTSALQISNAQTEPVPEPLTIFGTAVAGGFGVMLRRKRSKNQA
ncbi:MAG: PEP-CTERM sorting domain-containing protein [Richelia sp. RM2_1_2]|nr:PEP-CTERM sorting domain-containing protein [Richelia sp. SM2_1_7]NJO60895.1 PEP-CTERM sorting domain-containing protein [Richelia sp. RM2_1_2]